MKNLIWNYGKGGVELSGLVAGAGTLLTAALGGWDKPLQCLLVLMFFDFILGIAQAFKNKNIDSKVAFWGGVNKVIVIMLVVAGTFADKALGLAEPVMRTAIICFYCGREGLSLVENCGKLGLPIPSFVVKFLEQLKDNGDKGPAMADKVEPKKDVEE